VRRDENLESVRFRGLEDALDVLNGIVFLKTFADQWPREACFTQYLILRVDEYYCGVVLIYIHCCSFLLILTLTGFGLDHKSASAEKPYEDLISPELFRLVKRL